METTKPLTKEEEEVVTGLCLGGGHIALREGEPHPILSAMKDRKLHGYLRWLRNRLKRLTVNRSLEYKTVAIQKERRKDVHHFVLLETVPHPTFKTYKIEFGAGMSRRVPKNIEDYLTPLAVAVLYMERGRLYAKRNVCHIHMGGYKTEDSSRLSEALEKKFKLTSRRVDTDEMFGLILDAIPLLELIGEQVWKVAPMRRLLPKGFHVRNPSENQTPNTSDKT